MIAIFTSEQGMIIKTKESKATIGNRGKERWAKNDVIMHPKLQGRVFKRVREREIERDFKAWSKDDC